ncbi:MAG TPA: conjugal transfer protein TrbC [Acidobacteria bacterium]|nr:conjugal transfer protein TrbC [Acidobacteriota bacterium]
MKKAAQLLLLSLLIAAPAAASTGGASMPWDTALQALVDNLSGTVVHLVLLGLMAIAGIVWAASDHAQGIRRLSQIIFGGALAVEAVAILSTFGLGGAVL